MSYMGTAFGSLKLIRTRSAFLPASSDPISFSMCNARAPSMVAIATTSFAPRANGSIFEIFASLAARSISSIRSRSLLLPAGAKWPHLQILRQLAPKIDPPHKTEFVFPPRRPVSPHPDRHSRPPHLGHRRNSAGDHHVARRIVHAPGAALSQQLAVRLID